MKLEFKAFEEVKPAVGQESPEFVRTSLAAAMTLGFVRGWEAIDNRLPFMTSGCRDRTMENACNRSFSNCTPYQAYVGEMRNYPFTPSEEEGLGCKDLYSHGDSPF